MTREEYEKLPPKNNGMPEVKLRTSSNLDESNPLAMLYGKVTKHNETACKVINYGLLSNKVVVSNWKVGGQCLQHNVSSRHYQGDVLHPLR